MSNQIKKKHSKEFKLKVALDVVNSEYTLTELCAKYGLHKSVLQRWKRILLEEGAKIFEAANKTKQESEKVSDLERKIGQLTMEIDFLKKVLGQ